MISTKIKDIPKFLKKFGLTDDKFNIVWVGAENHYPTFDITIRLVDKEPDLHRTLLLERMRGPEE